MMATITQRLFYFPCRLFFKIFLGFEVRGQERVNDLRKPFLIVANHRSLIDPWLIGASLPFRSEFFPVRYIGGSKFRQPLQTLYSFGIISLIYRFFGAIVIPSETTSLEEKIRPIVGALRQGEIVVMFPEGRRYYHDGIGEFKKGAAEIYLRTKSLVVPMAIKKSRKKTIISIGQPIALTGETAESVTLGFYGAVAECFRRI